MLGDLDELKQKIRIWKIKFDIWLYKIGLKPMSMELLQEMAELGGETRITPSEFYDVYIAEDIASEDVVKRYEYLLYERTFISKSGESLTKVSRNLALPSKNELRYMGFKDELEYFKRSHAWLTTYAPYKKPRYVVTMIVEHGGHGGSAAGEIVGKIYNKLVDLNYIKKKVR